MHTKPPLRVAIIGTAKRSDYLYGPLIKALPDQVELVAVWGRSPDSTQRLSQSLGVPGYTDLEVLMRETAPEIGVVSVNYHANGQVGLMASRSRAARPGRNPHRPPPAAKQMPSSQPPTQCGLKIEVAEQFHRRPLEQIKLKLIASGLFGRVYSAFNDFAGMGTMASACCVLTWDSMPSRCG